MEIEEYDPWDDTGNPWLNSTPPAVHWGVDDLTVAEWLQYEEIRNDPDRLTIILCRRCNIHDHYHPSGYCLECRRTLHYVDPFLIQEEP